MIIRFHVRSSGQGNWGGLARSVVTSMSGERARRLPGSPWDGSRRRGDVSARLHSHRSGTRTPARSRSGASSRQSEYRSRRHAEPMFALLAGRGIALDRPFLEISDGHKTASIGIFQRCPPKRAGVVADIDDRLDDAGRRRKSGLHAPTPAVAGSWRHRQNHSSLRSSDAGWLSRNRKSETRVRDDFRIFGRREVELSHGTRTARVRGYRGAGARINAEARAGDGLPRAPVRAPTAFREQSHRRYNTRMAQPRLPARPAATATRRSPPCEPGCNNQGS